METEITKFDAMAAWFNFSDKKDHFYLEDGTHVEVDFLNIDSVISNRKYMGEICSILEKRREFVKSSKGLSFFMKNFIVPINK